MGVLEASSLSSALSRRETSAIIVGRTIGIL
jgi:hypothetical protein